MPSFLPEPVRYMICGALESEYKKLKASIDGFLNALKSDILGIENGLKSITSPIDDIMSGIKDMLGALKGAIPNLSDADSIQAILKFIQACTWLKDHKRFSDAYQLMKGLYDQYITEADNFMKGYKESKSEFSLASQLNDYIDKIIKFKLGEKLLELQKILACIEAICALDKADNPIQEIVDGVNDKKAKLTQIFEDSRTKVDGSLDKDKVFDNANLTKEKKFGMNNSMNAFAKVGDAFKEAHANAVAATKDESPPFPDTEVLTHLNTPTFVSTSVLYDNIDPDLEYEDDFIEYWNNINTPTGTTTKKGDLDVIVEISSCSLVETPDPDVNCYSVYSVLMNIIIGFKECYKITQTVVSDENNPAIVKHYDHGFSTGQTISISDSTHGFDGDFEIIVIDDDTFSFVSPAIIGEEQGVKISLLISGEGEVGIGNPICGTCFKYNTFGLSACNDTQKSFMRKHLAKAINAAMADAMSKLTVEDITGQLL